MNPRRRRLLQALAAPAAWGAAGCATPAGEAAPADLLATLERRCFDYFWDHAHPDTGLVPDRWPTPSFCSVAAVGFGLSAYAIGAQRGWVTREAACARALQVLRFMAGLPQGPQPQGTAGHRGFFYHFLHMHSGLRFERCELSTVDTALLLTGALHAQAYFDGAAPAEAQLRATVDQIVLRVDWRWAQPRAPLIGHGWHPETGFIGSDWRAYDESMIVYLIALGSPGQAVGDDTWAAWASGLPAAWGSAWGQQHLRFAPLFGHQFTHAWVDLRGIQDEFMRSKGLDYFENSRRATLAQRAYAIANPEGWAGYGPEVWGISACDGPADVQREFGGRKRRFISYAGRGMGAHDDGTIAPYAAGSSMPFAPEIAAPALAAMHARHGHAIWGRHGFFAFNPSFSFTDVKLTHGRIVPGLGWVDTDYLGIEVGPLLLALANHRSEAVWAPLRRHPVLRRGLQRAGFRGGWLG